MWLGSSSTTRLPHFFIPIFDVMCSILEVYITTNIVNPF